MMFKKIILIISSLLLIMLLSIACAPAAMPAIATQTAVPTTLPGNQPTQAVLPVTSNLTVTVTETEFKLDMPDSVQAGTVTFNITNKGTVSHSLKIQGQGIDQQLPSILEPGQSGTFQATLKPGTYLVFCPIDAHKSQGMMMNLTVK